MIDDLFLEFPSGMELLAMSFTKFGTPNPAMFGFHPPDVRRAVLLLLPGDSA